MRILLATRNFFPKGVIGGAQVSVSTLGTALQRLGHEVAILSVDRDEHVGLHLDTKLPEFRVRAAPAPPSGSSVIQKAVWHAHDRFGRSLDTKYDEVLKKFRPDVINTNVLAGLSLAVWRSALKNGVPVVHTVHDYYLLCIKSGMRRSGVNCSEPCKSCMLSALIPSRRSVGAVQEVIYVSEHMRKVHKSSAVFPEQISTSVIAGSYSPLEKTYRQATIKKGDIISLGFLGRIAPEKGLRELLRELESLPLQRWRLVVGGSGDPQYLGELKSAAAHLPVEFIGPTTPHEFLPLVDALIVNSLWHEPAARVVYEAGSHGVVPVVAARGGLPELVAYGTRGMIFEPDVSGSLAAAVLALIDQPERLVDFQCRWQDAGENFAPHAVASQTAAIYERAISEFSSLSVRR